MHACNGTCGLTRWEKETLSCSSRLLMPCSAAWRSFHCPTPLWTMSLVCSRSASPRDPHLNKNGISTKLASKQSSGAPHGLDHQRTWHIGIHGKLMNLINAGCYHALLSSCVAISGHHLYDAVALSAASFGYIGYSISSATASHHASHSLLKPASWPGPSADPLLRPDWPVCKLAACATCLLPVLI